MSHKSPILEKQPVSIQNLNGFDLSHINTGTAICAKLTPVLRKLLMPGSKFSLGIAMNVELPPLATNFFGRIDAVVECFFVPCAILSGGWKQFISNQVATMFPADQSAIENAGGYALPLISFGDPSTYNLYQSLESSNRGLSDYLGVRFYENADWGYPEPILLNMLPYLAYHRIWDVFYRNPSVTKTIFAVNPNWENAYPATSVSGFVMGRKNVCYVWHSFYAEESFTYSGSSNPSTIKSASNIFSLASELAFPDGISILAMRQRNWSRVYFTAASRNPQMGNPSSVGVTVDLNTGEGEITVAALRAANSLQKWLEAMNYDPSYRGIMRNHFGVSPSDAEMDEPSYIGRVVIPVYQKSVYQQNDQTGSGSVPNPFAGAGDLASKGASGSFSGEGQICQKYRVNCFGYLMGIFSLVPHAMYPYGVDREMFATGIGDFPFPELQGVGMDGIKNYEIFADPSLNAPNLFDDWAYIGRYSSYKYIEDSVHGELRPGRTLQAFVLQRQFSSLPAYSTAFFEIPETALNGVFATNVSLTNFSCWYEIYWVFKLVQPLAAYCVPTLGDIKDTHTQYTTQGGSRLD